MRIAWPFSGSTQRWYTPVTLHLTSSLLTMVYAATRHCTCRAEISSVDSSLFTRKLRMGCAHEGAAISSTARTATCTRAVGLGGGGLESAAACCVDEVPGPTAAAPGLGSEVPGLGATAAAPEPPAEVPEPTAIVPKSDPTASGVADTKMESDYDNGLTDGLGRRCRATLAGLLVGWSRSVLKHLLARCHFAAHGGTHTLQSIH